jgi:hypothetical protein
MLPIVVRKPASVIAVGLLACGGDETERDARAENAPPRWDPPAAIALGQGQTVRVPVTAEDDDGDAVSLAGAAIDSVALEVALGEGAVELHAGYAAPASAELSVELRDARGATATVRVAVAVARQKWLPQVTWTSDGPEAREHASFLVDAQGRGAYLFGGSGYSPYLDPLADAWRYDLATATWASVVPRGAVPSGGGSRRVAQLPGTTTAYLFGGYDGTGASHAELVRADFAGGTLTFTPVAQTNPPPARSLHAFVYDPETKRFYAFGGAGSALLDDTWSMELDGAGGAVWTELGPATRPSPRYGFFYGFDAEHGRLLVFSGAQGGAVVDPARDTWALDVRREPPEWSRVLEGDAVPPGRRNGSFVFDPAGPRLWVFGGTADGKTSAPGLWALDARSGHEAWAEVELAGEPPIRSSGFGFYDPVADRTLLGFGNTASAVYRDLTPLGYP